MYKEDALLLGEAFQNFACNAIPDNCFEEADDCSWVIPYIVNVAFACELYLKSFSSSGENEIKGHKWNTIYEGLTNDKKSRIKNHPQFAGDEEFEEKLEEGGRLFESWRYSFEKGTSRSVEFVFLDTFADVIHNLAKEDLFKLRKE